VHTLKLSGERVRSRPLPSSRPSVLCL
jgi:hypothetical protein